MNAIQQALHKAGLVRSTRGSLLGGVCAGLAQRTGLTPWQMRAVFVLMTVVLPGSQIILYPIAWVLMPDDTFGGHLPPAPQDRLNR